METRRIVEELLRRIESGDPEDIARLFGPRVDFLCAGDAPWIKPRNTREDMANFFREMDESFVMEDRSSLDLRAPHRWERGDGDGERQAATGVKWRNIRDPVRPPPHYLREG